MGAFFHGLITRLEFKNPLSTRNKYRDEIENRYAYVAILVYIFSFEMGFSLEPFCHTKRHDKYIFTHPYTSNVRLTFCATKWVWTSPLRLN